MTNKPTERDREVWRKASNAASDQRYVQEADESGSAVIANYRAQIERDTVARLAARSGVNVESVLSQIDHLVRYEECDNEWQSRRVAIITEVLAAAVAGERARRDAEIVEIRKLVTLLYCAAGCSCCRDCDGWYDASKKLGAVLNVPIYADGSGYDWYALRDAIERGEIDND